MPASLNRVDEIKALRKEGLSYTEIADRLQLHPNTIYKKLRADRESGSVDGMTVRKISVLTGPDGEKLRWTQFHDDKTPDIVSEVRAALEDFTARAPQVAAPQPTDDHLASVYICADWHIGLLTWAAETGVNYDLPIAQRVIRDTIGRLMASAPNSSQAIVLGLGDLLHSDGYDNATPTSKHALDVDGRYPKILRVATMLLVHAIDAALRKHQKVLVRVLPGNHDPESAIAVSLALALYYKDQERVTVDDDPGYFWWWSWGSSFVGATHGDQAKMPDLPLLMAARNPQQWGKSKFRYIYTGHVHSQTGIEKSGVTVESFQTPAAADAWHRRKGYGATRSMTSITLHKEFGEIGRQKANIM